MMRSAVVIAALLAPALAHADSALEASAETRQYVDLRIGGSAATAGGRPALCLEAFPLRTLAFEACGSGTEFREAEDRPRTEIAHFRGKWTVTRLATRRGLLEPHLGAGFAELEVGEDSPGFAFGSTGPNGVETAGPELGAGLRFLSVAGRGFEVVGDLGLGAAWFPRAPNLVRPQREWQFSAAATVGVGF